MKGGLRIGNIWMMTRQGGFFIDLRITVEYHFVSTPPAQAQTSELAYATDLFFGFKYFMF
jgi:hypothetical protein